MGLRVWEKLGTESEWRRGCAAGAASLSDIAYARLGGAGLVMTSAAGVEELRRYARHALGRDNGRVAQGTAGHRKPLTKLNGASE